MKFKNRLFYKLLNKFLICALMLGGVTWRKAKSMDVVIENSEVIAKALAVVAAGVASYVSWKTRKTFPHLPSKSKDYLDEIQFSTPTIKNQTESDKDIKLKIENLPYGSQCLINKKPDMGRDSFVKAIENQFGFNLNKVLPKDRQGEYTHSESKTYDGSVAVDRTEYLVLTNSEVFSNSDSESDAKTEKLLKLASIFTPESVRNKNPKFNFNFNKKEGVRLNPYVDIKVDNAGLVVGLFQWISQIFKISAIQELERRSLELTLEDNIELKEKHNEALNQIIKFACKVFNDNCKGSDKYKSYEERYKNLLLLNRLNALNSEDISILGGKTDSLNKLVRFLNSIYFDKNGNRLHPSKTQDRERNAKDLILSFIKNVASNKEHYKELIELAHSVTPVFEIERRKACYEEFKIDYDNGFIKSVLKSIGISDYFLTGGVSSEAVLDNRNNQTILKIIHYCANQIFSIEDRAFINRATEELDNLDRIRDIGILDIARNIIGSYKSDLKELKKAAQNELAENSDFRELVLNSLGKYNTVTQDSGESISEATATADEYAISEREQKEFFDKLRFVSGALSKDKSKPEVDAQTKTKNKRDKCENCGRSDVNLAKPLHNVEYKKYKLSIIEKKYLENKFNSLNVKVNGVGIKFKDIGHIFKPTIKCEVDEKIKARRYKITGLHHDLNGEISQKDVDLNIKQGPCNSSGCKVIYAKFKNSKLTPKTCFPDWASREQVISWIAESIKNKTEIMPPNNKGVSKIVGYAYILGHKVKIITTVSIDGKNEFVIQTAHPDF